MRAFVALIAVVLATPTVLAVDRDPAGFERLLLPIAFQAERPGALGSRWVSELIVRNETNSPAQIFQLECAFFCECVAVTCTTIETPPRSRFGGHGSPDILNPANPGIFLYIGRSASESVPVQLRVRDVSRSALTWGTEIPVVRESDLLSGVTYLLDVPMSPLFRVHLRLYGATFSTDQATVRVVISDANTGAELAAQRVTLRMGGFASPQPLTEGSRPSHPAFGEIAFLERSVPAGAAQPAKVNVRLEPETPDLKYWGMISITNNDTQQVTLVTPQ